jgi:hypothetical protein
MFFSEMCASSGVPCDWNDERAATLSTSDAASPTNHDDAAGSWEQAWIDLGGEG